MNSEKIYQIALTLAPKVGDVAAKKLIAYCGSAEAVFKETRKSLMMIPGVGSVMANSMVKVISWYDNEWGYSNRLVDLASFVGERLSSATDA